MVVRRCNHRKLSNYITCGRWNVWKRLATRCGPFSEFENAYKRKHYGDYKLRFGRRLLNIYNTNGQSLFRRTRYNLPHPQRFYITGRSYIGYDGKRKSRLFPITCRKCSLKRLRKNYCPSSKVIYFDRRNQTKTYYA